MTEYASNGRQLVQLMLAASLAVMLSTPVAAAQFAILIGASDYDDPSIKTLNGPPNDAVLMHHVLGQMGFDTMIVLTEPDALAGAVRPTRGAIDDAMRQVLDAITVGDRVVLFMAGHGTRVPDLDGDEQDGYDEAFLPVDAQLKSGQAILPNALVDDSIGIFSDAVRAKGANIWLIMDSCFSGTASRDTAVSRMIPEADLGLAQPPAQPVAPSPQVSGDSLPGELVAFYAAQANEKAYEYSFGDKVYGLFTAKLAERLRTAGKVSYRQLFEAVLGDVAGYPVPSGGVRQTPLVEGTALDTLLTGGEADDQFAVAEGKVAAGLLQGLGPASVLSLYREGTDGEGTLLGHVQVVSAEALTAKIQPVSADCLPTAGALCTPLTGAEADFVSEARFARVSASLSEAMLRLSPVLMLDDDPTNTGLLEDLQQAAALAGTSLGTPVALDAAASDVSVAIGSGRLWFSRSGDFGIDRPSNIAWPADLVQTEPDMEQLASTLHIMAKAQALIGVAQTLRDGRSPLAFDSIRVNVEHRQALVDAASTECPSLAQTAPIAPLPQFDVSQCDKVSFSLSPKGEQKTFDVNIVYIDANFAITVQKMQVSVPSTAPVRWTLQLCAECQGGWDDPVVFSDGPEALLVLSAPFREGQMPFDLSYLEHPGVPSVDTSTKGEPNAAQAFVTELFSPASGGSRTAGFLEDIEVDIFQWRVLPRGAVADNGAATQ